MSSVSSNTYPRDLARSLRRYSSASAFCFFLSGFFFLSLFFRYTIYTNVRSDQLGNVGKVNNPNQQSNQQSGPPTSQSNNPTQGSQNNNQWPQGKSNPGGLGQNPSVQNNNNSGGVQQQQQSSASSASNNQSNNPTQGAVSIGSTAASNNPSTKQQLEQLNTMREALFSQDGWGCVSGIRALANCT